MKSVKLNYSTSETSTELIDEIKVALKNIRWGSLEIFIQNSKVVQITERNIKKMNESSDNVKKKPVKTTVYKSGS